MLGKIELVQQIAQKTGLSNAKANEMLNVVLDTFTEALARGEELRLTGFGSFKVMETKERTAINPRTRQPVHVPAGKRLSFSAGSQLMGAIKGETGRKAA